MKPAIGILIGGQSRRMGRPKALIRLGGATLLEQTVETAGAISRDIVLLGEPRFELPASLQSLPIVPDHHPHTGPIGGLESLLISRPNADGILLACDLPYLPEELLNRLIAVADGEGDRVGSPNGDREGDPNDAVVCTTPTGPVWHPCAALYRPACLPAVQTAIHAGAYGMIQLLSRLRVRRVELTGDEARWVENWNEPADLPP